LTIASLTVVDSKRTDCSQQTKNWVVSVPAGPVNIRIGTDCSMLVGDLMVYIDVTSLNTGKEKNK